MLLSRTTGSAFAFLAFVIPADAGFSNVQVSQFQQAGLDLSFLVSWDTAADPSADSHLIDIWLETRQPDPSSFVETVLHRVSESLCTTVVYLPFSRVLRLSAGYVVCSPSVLLFCIKAREDEDAS